MARHLLRSSLYMRWIAFIFLLTSCAAQIKVNTPTVGAISPESLGSFGSFELGGGYTETSGTEITSDASLYAPDTTTPQIIRSGRILGQGGMGLLPGVDFYFDPHAWANLKLQLIGKNFGQAKKGNFSFSLLGGFGWKDDKGDGKSLGFTDKQISVAPDITYTLKATQWKGGFLTGYRVADAILFYGGANYQSHHYSGTFDNFSGRDGSFSGRVITKSINLGVEFKLGTSFVVRMENAYTANYLPKYGSKSTGNFFGVYLAGVESKEK